MDCLLVIRISLGITLTLICLHVGRRVLFLFPVPLKSPVYIIICFKTQTNMIIFIKGMDGQRMLPFKQ
jgi:hypothetical protein